MGISLKKSTKNELNELSKIYATEFSKPPYNEKWTFKKAGDKMRFYLRYYDMFTIKLDERLVGFIVLNPNFMCPGEVVFGEEMAIKSQYQNKGIGTQVVSKIFEIYKQKGYKRFIWIANMESSAYKLYLGLGIKPSKRDVLIEKKLN